MNNSNIVLHIKYRYNFSSFYSLEEYFKQIRHFVEKIHGCTQNIGIYEIYSTFFLTIITRILALILEFLHSSEIYSTLNEIYSTLNEIYSTLNEIYSTLNEIYSTLNF